MSIPMPLTPGAMCSLCFDQIRDGEHWVDEHGDRWDSHSWCHLTDQAAVLRRDAMRRRGVKDNCGCLACKTLRADDLPERERRLKALAELRQLDDEAGLDT